MPVWARAFDLRIGERAEQDWRRFPGREAGFAVEVSGFCALDDEGVGKERSWNDVDGDLPDAATTIVGMQNLHVGRWECMFRRNGFLSIVGFGGVQEDERLVLHPLEVDRSVVPMNCWIHEDGTVDGCL